MKKACKNTQAENRPRNRGKFRQNKSHDETQKRGGPPDAEPSQNQECQAKPGTPSVCLYPPPLRRTVSVKARPAPVGGGPVHFSLDGGWAAEYAPTGDKRRSAVPFPGALFQRRFHLWRWRQRFGQLLVDGGAVSLNPPAHLQLPPQSFDGLIDR